MNNDNDLNLHSMTKLSADSLLCMIVMRERYKQVATGSGQKKVATHRKWDTWFIMAINEENVNKSYVFCTCVGTCG